MKQVLLTLLCCWYSSCSAPPPPPAAPAPTPPAPQAEKGTPSRDESLDAQRGQTADRLARLKEGTTTSPKGAEAIPGAASGAAAPGGEAPPTAPLATPERKDTGSLDDLRKARDRMRDDARDAPLGVENFSEEDERKVGEATARSLLARVRTLPVTSPIAVYVRRVGAILVENSGRPGIPYRFIVVEAEEVNAFAAPYGYIFVTTGALRFAQNEAEIALILAHEIVHVEKKHGLAMIVRGYLDVSKRSARDRLNELSAPPPADVKARRESMEKRMDALSDLILKGYGLPHEQEADRDGILLVAKTGYDPRAAAAILRRIASAAPAADDKQPVIFRSHPQPGERLAAVTAFAGSLAPGGAVLAERYREAMKALK